MNDTGWSQGPDPLDGRRWPQNKTGWTAFVLGFLWAIVNFVGKWTDAVYEYAAPRVVAGWRWLDGVAVKAGDRVEADLKRWPLLRYGLTFVGVAFVSFMLTLIWLR